MQCASTPLDTYEYGAGADAHLDERTEWFCQRWVVGREGWSAARCWVFFNPLSHKEQPMHPFMWGLWAVEIQRPQTFGCRFTAGWIWAKPMGGDLYSCVCGRTTCGLWYSALGWGLMNFLQHWLDLWKCLSWELGLLRTLDTQALCIPHSTLHTIQQRPQTPEKQRITLPLSFQALMTSFCQPGENAVIT